MGYRVGEVVGKRLGRAILELGGNNAVIVTAHADLDLALPAVLFGSVGTAGQRCTSTRRIVVHESVREEFVERLTRAYEGVPIGNPLESETLMGPLVNLGAVEDLQNAIRRVRKEGGEILHGGEPLEGPEFHGGHYVRPCIASAQNSFGIVQEETFAPILYIIGYGDVTACRKESVDELAEAMQLHNDVPQGLSSAIFTEPRPGSGVLRVAPRERLRHRQREHRDQRRRNRWRFRWRKGDGWREGVRLRRLESLHAATDQHGQLEHRTTVGPKDRVRFVGSLARTDESCGAFARIEECSLTPEEVVGGKL